MAITIDDSGVIFQGDNPIIIPRDGNYDTVSFLGGFDDKTDGLGNPTPEFQLGQFTTDGRLKVDANLSVSEVNVGAVEIEDKSGPGAHRLDVAVLGAPSALGVDNDTGIISMGVDDNNKVRALPIVDLGLEDGYAVKVDIASALELEISNDIGHPLPVQIVSGNKEGAPTNTFDSISAVSTGIPEIIVSYAVPEGKTFYVKHVMASGGNKAFYELLIGEPDTPPGTEPIVAPTVEAVRRSYYTNFEVDFTFESQGELGLKVPGGKVVAVRVTHSEVGHCATADFEGNIYGRLVG